MSLFPRLSAFSRRITPVLAGFSLLCVSLAPAQTNVGAVRNAPVLKAGQTLPDVDLDATPGKATIRLADRLEFPAASGEYARMRTPFGDIYVEFFKADAPLTVANFKTYLATPTTSAQDLLNTYDGTFIHRAVPGFVIQGGGYRPVDSLPEIGPPLKNKVNNEFSVANTRGTIAMAKVGPDPGEEPDEESINSATNEWFINLADNRSILDNQNGGFTAFARVLGDGMKIVDRIANLPQLDLNGPLVGGAFDNLPYYNVQPGQTELQFFNLFPITTLREVAAGEVPAALKAAPTITTSLAGNTSPTVVKAAISKNVLTLTPGKNGGRAVVTVRASAGNGLNNDFSFTVTKIGPPVVLKAAPAKVTVPLGGSVALKADVTAWPISYQWQVRSSPAAIWTNIANGEVYSGADTDTLRFSLPAADTTQAADSLAANGFQYRYLVGHTSEQFGSRPLEGAPTTLNITTELAFTAKLPATTTVALGGSTTLTVAATGASLPAPTFQWQRRASPAAPWQNINDPVAAAPASGETPAVAAVPSPYSGTKTRSLVIRLNGTTPASGTGISTVDTLALDRGQYRCVITHNRGTGAVSAESTPTTLRITRLPVAFAAQPAKTATGTLGGTASISVTAAAAAANTPVSFQWQRRNPATKVFEPVANSTTEAPTRYSGATTRTLTINLAGADDAAKLAALALNDEQYRCVITNLLGSATSTAASLRVVTDGFSVVTAEDKALPGLAAGAGRTFTAAGMPKGLVLNATTGRVAGVASAKAGLYRVVVTIREGGVVTGTQVYYLNVAGLSGNNAGGYEAFLRTAEVPPYAKLQILIASNGTFSGLLTTTDDPKAIPFRGAVVRSASTGALSLAEPIILSRAGEPAGRALSVDFDVTSAGVFTAELKTRATAGGAFAAKADAGTERPGVRVSGNGPPWANIAAYTMVFTDPAAMDEEDERAIPAGSGFALANVFTDGALRLTGKLGDGTPLTAFLSSGTDATYRLLARPYGTAADGYFSARLRLTDPAGGAVRYSVATVDGGDVFWAKPELPKSAAYREGFGPLDLTVRMEPFAFSGAEPIGFIPNTANTAATITLVLAGGGVSNEAPNARGLPTTLNLAFNGLRFTATAPTAGAAGFAGGLNLDAGGKVTGSFKLVDPGQKTRTVKFEALLVVPPTTPANGAVTFEGFMTVPQLDGSPPLSGRVQLKRPGTPPPAP